MKRTTELMAAMAVVAATMLLASGTANAALLAYEGFNVSAGDLDGQATGPSGSLFGGGESWSLAGDSSVDGMEGQTTGLGYTKNTSVLTTSGGRAKAFRNSTFDDSVGTTARLRNQVSSTAFTETYFSALIDADSLANANKVQIGWDHKSQTGGNELRLLGLEIRGTGDIFTLAGENNAINSDTGLDLAAGVNLLLVRITEKTQGNNTDEYDLWLNPDPAAIGAPNYSSAISAPGFNEGLVVGNGSYGFDGFWLNAAFNGNGNGPQQSILIDELRLATSVGEALPFTTAGNGNTGAIPEPASAALVLLAGLGLAARRRRQA